MWRLVVEEEGGIIDERPGKVLHASQAFVGELGFGLLSVLAELHEFAVELDRQLGGRECALLRRLRQYDLGEPDGG